jgi:hypothetical protein
MNKLFIATAVSLCLAGSAHASACSDRKVLKTVVNKFFGELSFLALPPADEDVKEEKTGMLGRIMGRVDCSVCARLDSPYANILPPDAYQRRIRSDSRPKRHRVIE